MVEITGIVENSPAALAGIRTGDRLVSLDGHSVRDVLDYMFYASETAVEVVTERDGVRRHVRIVKDEYDDLGLEFASFLMDRKQSCRNKCVFCFIDQMPPGMRDTLYFKDDDARLSFLQGNYVTLTNLTQEDVDRIIRMKLNINVSVHTTDPDLRCQMMQNRFAGKTLDYLWQMAAAGIRLNCQIVLCPGLNDGDALRRTLTDLGRMMPNLTSVAVVPVGLSKFREGLYPLTPFTPETAAAALDLIAGFQTQFLQDYGTRVVFPSDEFFLLAGRDLPEAAYYEGYPQYENGVGMLRSLADEFRDALADADAPGKRSVTIATGMAVYPFLCGLIREAEQRFPDLQCHVCGIRNDFFGHSITVTGLLTGQDLIAQLRTQPPGDRLLLSEAMFRRDSELFLDDLTISDVEQALHTKICVVPNDGYALLDAILGEDDG